MSLKPGTANPYPESPADEGQLSFMRIQMETAAGAATSKDVDLLERVGQGPPSPVPPIVGDSAV